jgi:hypothetical protein
MGMSATIFTSLTPPRADRSECDGLVPIQAVYYQGGMDISGLRMSGSFESAGRGGTHINITRGDEMDGRVERSRFDLGQDVLFCSPLVGLAQKDYVNI